MPSGEERFSLSSASIEHAHQSKYMFFHARYVGENLGMGMQQSKNTLVSQDQGSFRKRLFLPTVFAIFSQFCSNQPIIMLPIVLS
jgi:hypothetical protein